MDSDCGEPLSKSRRQESPETLNESCQIMVDNSQNVLSVIQSLYREKQMCDVLLVVGNTEHHAHRLILCAFSDVFQAMLMKPEWSEWHESRVELQELMPECEKVFHSFLEYFYTGKILITHTNAMPLLALADKYIVKGLSRLCVDYMCKHVPHASSHNQLFNWLQYSVYSGHTRVAQKCQNFIKWNFEAIANTPDFSNVDAEMLIRILQDSDLVVYNEMVLYNCIVRWLDLQRIKLSSSGNTCEEIDDYMKNLVENVMRHIRFPMMYPRELANLLLSPLIKHHKEFFLERMSMGMAFHSNMVGTQTAETQLFYTPRLYTSDVYSAVLQIENFHNLPSYHVRTFLFYSKLSTAEHESDKVIDWVVDLYPKGVWFKKCFLIVWQGTLEISEIITRTIRLALTCKEVPENKLRLKVTVLIYGIQGGVEHVMEMKEKIHQFNTVDKVLNIDDLIDFTELNPGASDTDYQSPYLIGPNRDELKLNIIITPLSSYC